jgi:hypothetical protein
MVFQMADPKGNVMNRLLLAVTLWVGLAGAGWALTIEQQLLASLQAQGYVILEQGYTFLGRLRIVAQNDEIRREIVVNPGTGEILRDYAVMLPRIATLKPSTGKSGGTSSAATAVGTGSGTLTATAAGAATSTGTTTGGSATTEPDQNSGETDVPSDPEAPSTDGLDAPDVILVDPLLPFRAGEP